MGSRCRFCTVPGLRRRLRYAASRGEVQGVLDALGIERANVAGYDRNASDDCDAVRGVAAYCRTGRRPGSQTHIASRMSFTEEPTHIWEVGEPAPFEITEPCHEPAVPELELARI